MQAKIKGIKHRLGIWLAFRKLFKLWKSISPFDVFYEKTNPHLVIIPCDPFSVGGSRGDEAMITAVIQKYRMANPQIPITIISGSEEGNLYITNLPFKHIYPLYVWTGNNPIERIYNSVIDLHPSEVILLGADCMDGFYSPFISLTLLALHDLFSRTAGIKSRLLGFSFNGHPYKPLIKAYDSLSEDIVLNLRDEISLARFVKRTSHKAGLVSDAAFMLIPDSDFQEYSNLRDWIKTSHERGISYVIGFNFHPMLRKYKDSNEIQNDALTLAKNLVCILREDTSINFVLIPHDDRNRLTDNMMLNVIAEQLKSQGFEKRIYYIQHVYRASQLKAICGLLDGLVSSRMHLAIAALGQKKSVFAVTYQGKFEGLYRHFELSTHYLLTPTDFMSDKMVSRFHSYIDQLPELTNCVQRNLNKVVELSEKNLL